VQKLLSLFGRAVANDGATVDALRRNDRVAAQRLARQTVRLDGRASSIAAALGADYCANDSIFDETS